MKQLQLDSTYRVLIGVDEGLLRPGFVAVTDDIFASFVAATTTVYYNDGVLTGPSYSVVAASLAAQIDAQVAGIYAQWTRFEQEYVQRAAAATAYKAAGYTGDCSVWITAFANAAGLTNKVATDTILSQANILDGALSALGALRMRKYEILGGKDLTSVQASYDDISSKIAAIAAQIS